MSEPKGHAYRRRVRAGGLAGFAVRVEQTDLFVRASRDMTDETYDLVRRGRERIESWAAGRPEFLTSLHPLPSNRLAPSPVREMLEAGRTAGVGPMAAVAGALAEFVGLRLIPASPEGVIVENGGDVFLQTADPVTIGLFAGVSKLSLRLGLRIEPRDMPAGVCTSSGRLGHSLSLGRADAATVVGASAALADAAATALGNRVREVREIEPALEWVLSLEGVRGAAVVLGDRLGFLGDLDLVALG
ncbi:MAG: UPF0280 family protein [Proteobacteria bacterium]|nr:UPF0280 family protein [Pseudomonadota bacterium]